MATSTRLTSTAPKPAAAPISTSTAALEARLPKITIEFCTQCKWMLRAAYYAQELLSTFGTAVGEIALRPSTGGTFVVTIEHETKGLNDISAEAAGNGTLKTLLWDRKIDQGFPETKELKRRVRDVIEPGRDLGHVDRHDSRKLADTPFTSGLSTNPPGSTISTADTLVNASRGSVSVSDFDAKTTAECEDCK